MYIDLNKYSLVGLPCWFKVGSDLSNTLFYTIRCLVIKLERMLNCKKSSNLKVKTFGLAKLILIHSILKFQR